MHPARLRSGCPRCRGRSPTPLPHPRHARETARIKKQLGSPCETAPGLAHLCHHAAGSERSRTCPIATGCPSSKRSLDTAGPANASPAVAPGGRPAPPSPLPLPPPPREVASKTATWGAEGKGSRKVRWQNARANGRHLDADRLARGGRAEELQPLGAVRALEPADEARRAAAARQQQLLVDLVPAE